jgi:hypothetical protein
MIAHPIKRVRYPETSIGLTWMQLTISEPRLRSLLREARRPTDLCSLCRWFGHRQGDGWLPGLKAAMEQLVGWECSHPDPTVRSSRAYDVAYRMLYDNGVPAQHKPCRVCGGLG